ncbi:probable cytochrome P450 305a1 [Uranotaenia lowii]|uniref:probable cytochrome P450 305a1 n=1 Tax=Uranotaenia lowii TaxID=190385 RepID=UPI00247A9002|nr:probable cytochrome P450 305a1 [Uranotaenia lowii]
MYISNFRNNSFPPGPLGLPFVGNSLLVRKLSQQFGGLHGVYQQLSEQFRSKMIGLRLGSERVVAILGYPLAREALTNEDLNGRPDNFFTRLRTMGQRMGITFTDGSYWEEHRAFVVRALKEVGFGRKPMESLMQQELHELIRELQVTDQAINPGKLIQLSVLNVLWTLATGKRMEKDDGRLQKLLDTMLKRSKQFDITGGILNQLPWLRFIAPNRTGYNLLKDLSNQLKDFFSETIEEHYATYDEENSSDDLIYAYIREIKARKDDPNSTFTDAQMIMTILDLFIAGSQTTGLVIELSLLMMAINPEIQTKVHVELDNMQNQLTWSNRSSLPYSEAVTMEVQRFFPVAAISGPRRATRDIKMGGYTIPKNTTVFVDLKSVHMDPEYWQKPEEFNPERFFDQNGNLVHSERLIPYSLGKRKCLGDTLAKASIFSFFVGVMERFEIMLPEGASRTVELIPGITHTPKDYLVSFKERTRV